MNPTAETVGLIAGWGDYPRLIMEGIHRQGLRVACVGIKGHALPEIEAAADEFLWNGMGKLGRAIRFFRKHGVRRAAMAGKFHKVVLYQPWVWFKHLPDWRAIRRFAPHFLFRRHDCTDNSLSQAVIDEFALDGIDFVPPTDFAPELLVKYGKLTSRGPTRAQIKDIEFGWKLARELGRLDIGQTVAVKGQAVLALEAIEGTDECIRRAGALCRSGGFTVVKVAKPGQDMRFDVPTIGIHTLNSVIEAGGRVLAIEAGKTIVVNEPEVIDYANKHRLVIVALEADGRYDLAPEEHHQDDEDYQSRFAA